MATAARYWVVIPAAGSGRRMGSATPKQYLSLGGKTVLEQTLDRFLHHAEIIQITGKSYRLKDRAAKAK
mgnify:CR=1 FL=1